MIAVQLTHDLSRAWMVIHIRIVPVGVECQLGPQGLITREILHDPLFYIMETSRHCNSAKWTDYLGLLYKFKMDYDSNRDL